MNVRRKSWDHKRERLMSTDARLWSVRGIGRHEDAEMLVDDRTRVYVDRFHLAVARFTVLPSTFHLELQYTCLPALLAVMSSGPEQTWKLPPKSFSRPVEEASARSHPSTEIAEASRSAQRLIQDGIRRLQTSSGQDMPGSGRAYRGLNVIPSYWDGTVNPGVPEPFTEQFADARTSLTLYIGSLYTQNGIEQFDNWLARLAGSPIGPSTSTDQIRRIRGATQLGRLRDLITEHERLMGHVLDTRHTLLNSMRSPFIRRIAEVQGVQLSVPELIPSEDGTYALDGFQRKTTSKLSYQGTGDANVEASQSQDTTSDTTSSDDSDTSMNDDESEPYDSEEDVDEEMSEEVDQAAGEGTEENPLILE